MSASTHRKVIEAALALAALALFAHYARAQWGFSIDYVAERLQMK